jgi:hypothetical protein
MRDKHNDSQTRLQPPVASDGVGVVGDAVQQRRGARPLGVLQELPHHAPVLLGLRHQPQDVPLPVQALRHRVPVEHAPRHGEARPGRGAPALELEPGKVAVLCEVVRGHEEQPPRGVAPGKAAARSLLVGGQPVQGKLAKHRGKPRQAPLFVPPTAI